MEWYLTLINKRSSDRRGLGAIGKPPVFTLGNEIR